MNLHIVLNVSVTNDTDLAALRLRIADHLRKLSNPVREDSGITTVNSVKISRE